ncbi:hypothetical protein E3O55_04900 [Cryobacterium sp. MDB1-18-2]|uniref:hypothetical protein n=1 Tax=unclassified Cryobacterium TaxID=2649013 RepID=UPI00106B3AD7|nr:MULTISPECIES: hypothetical protein [unclassified Cryobacterium]TFC32853.1 hypothetical protein E3O55_04900 [Cryobacterium sp. MDB1-18-2]TFC44597.1 hypothetical protein E3O50_04995 [Cryobacterium sp. MDB1-18-1]
MEKVRDRVRSVWSDLEHLRVDIIEVMLGTATRAPLSNTTFSPRGLQFSPRSQIGIALFIVGLAVLAFGAGWMLGQRQAASQRRLSDPCRSGN